MIPADAQIDTDGYVVSKTIKETYSQNGAVLTRELVGFVVMPKTGESKPKYCSVMYKQAMKD